MGKSGNPAKRAARQQSNPDALTVVWASNSPTIGTGYGTQTKQAVARMARDGHRVSIASNFGLEGHTGSWNGIRLWPKGYAHHSEDVLPAYTQAWGAECGDLEPWLFTLYDVWILTSILGKVERIASWVPIDHMPAPERVLSFLRHPTVTPIAMSKFGRDMIEQAGIECLYVPHALDGDYKPTPTFQGRTARDILGIPEDAYLITMNQANKGNSPSRKAWPENLMAAAEFMSRYDDVWLYLHTEDRGSMSGIDLHALAASVGLDMTRTRFADQFALRMGVPAELVAAIYTGSDVLLACSMGEGFGLTVLEAQACGTPVIVSNWTAQPELVGDGWCVDGQPYYNAPMAAWWLTPNLQLIVDALEQAYSRGRYRSQQAIDFARQYDADLVYDEFWRPALKVLHG